MNFYNYISSLHNDNLIIEYNADKQIPINYILRNKKKQIIAIGWDTIDTYKWPPIEAIIKALSISENEMYHWRGIIFSVKGNNLWKTEPESMTYPEMYKVDSFEEFLKEIKRRNPEVKSDVEQMIEKVTLEEYLKKLQLEYPKLGLDYILEEIKALKANNIWADQSYRDIYAEVEKLKEDLISKENQVNELKAQNEVSSKNLEIEERTNKYLSSVIKNATLKKLSKKQIEALINIIQNTKKGGRISFFSTGVMVNYDLMPDLIIKMNGSKMVAYDTASDWLSLPIVEYRGMKKNGEIENISVNKLFENPNAVIVPSQGYYLGGIQESDDLQGCVDLSIDDLMKLKEKNNE